jgi:hypothetical protein
MENKDYADFRLKKDNKAVLYADIDSAEKIAKETH